jgi:VanZ family protein
VFLYKTKIVVFLFLGFVTAFSSHFFDRYQDSGPEMLEDRDFKQEFGYWKVQKRPGCLVSMEDGVLHLFGTEIKGNIQCWQSVQDFKGILAVRVKAMIRCKDVVPGKKPWNTARLIMEQRDGIATQWNLPHSVALFSGTNPWKAYSSTFVIAPGTRELRVTAQLANCTGSMWLKDLSLIPVRQATWYGWAQKTIFSAWGLYLFFVLGSCMGSGKQNFLKILLVGLFALILVGTSMPGQIKKQITKEVEEQVHTYSSELIDTFKNIEQTFHRLIPWNISKIAHFVLFLGFGILLTSITPLNSGLYILLHLMLFAGATEFIQFYVDGRTPLAGDSLIDTIGGLLGIFMANSIKRIRQ